MRLLLLAVLVASCTSAGGDDIECAFNAPDDYALTIHAGGKDWPVTVTVTA